LAVGRWQEFMPTASRQKPKTLTAVRQALTKNHLLKTKEL
jgi:hypothetical protein